MNDRNITCPYCGNPNPEISLQIRSKRSTKFSFPKIFSHQRECIRSIRDTPLITCKLCGRKYFLFADKNDLRFIRDFLKNFVVYMDDVIDGLKYYEIDLEDLDEYATGIVQPVKSKKEVHLVIIHPKGRYYIRCIKEKGMYIAINIEKVTIT